MNNRIKKVLSSWWKAAVAVFFSNRIRRFDAILFSVRHSLWMTLHSRNLQREPNLEIRRLRVLRVKAEIPYEWIRTRYKSRNFKEITQRY